MNINLPQKNDESSNNPALIFSEEHTVIQKMIQILEISIENLKEVIDKKNDFFDVVIEFFRTFADKDHHGKEEFIFFKKLENKPLSNDEKKILTELIEEHKQGRALINELEKVKDLKDFERIRGILQKLIKLYKSHIRKENVVFFPPVFKYFSEEEKKQMVLEFNEVDKSVLFQKYKKCVEELSR